MNKMNKKGFTLIEMLVVIAIIAILVSIIIPVVSNSTLKASAATNAANLRAVLAQCTIENMTAGTPKWNAQNATVTDGPESKAVNGLCGAGESPVLVFDKDGNITGATYNGKNIEDFAAVAGGTAETQPSE